MNHILPETVSFSTNWPQLPFIVRSRSGQSHRAPFNSFQPITCSTCTCQVERQTSTESGGEWVQGGGVNRSGGRVTGKRVRGGGVNGSEGEGSGGKRVRGGGEFQEAE